MSAPDPEGFSMLQKVIAAGVAIIAPVWGLRTWFEKRMDKKADKNAVANQLQKIESEATLQRGHIGKLFDQIRDNEQKSEARHRELLMHLVGRKE